ncbi:MAG TPA: ABC transporter ATP-binding protein [Candidatus Limnocylindrales bacterium]|nr:ABC transporter ATP-binding protein [Candidatus Limnocylindrales bacterium]
MTTAQPAPIERVEGTPARPVLELRHVSVEFVGADDSVSAVSDVSLSVLQGEIFGLVGESGCGKSTLALAIMGLLPSKARVRGRIAFEGRELIGLGEREMRKLRGNRLSMVFQDPMTSLDPTFGIGEQVAETVRAHREVSADAARRRALQLLGEVGIPASEQRYAEPPHRFSGGMRQRVVVATALANDPALLLADEPTTALDVTIQAQILDLIRSLRARHRTTVVLITHDLGVIAQICDRVGVMYAGQLVEIAPVAELFASPRHPYTQALITALPTSDQERGSLRVIEGQVPDLTDPPPGCRFSPRCPVRRAECDTVPPLALARAGHAIACWADPATRAAAAAPTIGVADTAPGGARE